MIRKTFFLLIILALFGVFYFYEINSSVSNADGDVVFAVNKGESISQIGESLHQDGLVKSKFFFKFYVWRQKAKIKAGEYLLNSDMSIREIADILIKGEVLNNERVIKIIEGWDLRNVDDYFKKNKIVADDSFINLAEKRISAWKFGFGKPDFLSDAPVDSNLEGYLFPDTYRIFKDAGAEEIIGKMLNNFDKKLTDKLKKDIADQKKTIYQIVTMASIIEKEVRSVEDMKIVSGIFWNRMKNGQPLQSCATLAYILGVDKKQYTIEDTKINSPYNTYKNPGLPPGPIANPGLNAIKAAIYPEFTEYNYFLSDPDDGKTIFSKSLDEHNKNKAKYLN